MSTIIIKGLSIVNNDIYAPFLLSTIKLLTKMEKFNLNYSLKNIPIPSEKQYKLQMIEKIEAVIKRMRWKAIIFENQQKHVKLDENKTTKVRQDFVNNYGFKSNKCPAPVIQLERFEKELFDLINKIQFTNTRCEFQTMLKNDIKIIKSTTTTLTPADKTSNMYKITATKYKQLVKNAVTKTYKKAKENISDQINSEGKKIAEKMKISNRMNVNTKNECFITFKDHKQNFENKLPTRLINPAKNEIGRISKIVLENINSSLRKEIKIQQWKNTSDVMKWFENIKEKHECKFMMFDIKEFYPSITENLLKKSINHAKNYLQVSNDDIKLITHARNSLLYNNGETWVKRNNENFDVTMEAYDGAEVCDLVGIYLLSIISQKYDKQDIGLYRDDGLAVFRNISGKEADTIRKHFSAIFKLNGLSLDIECNQKIVNYLDVTLNLENGTYRPFRKPNESTTYIHAKSNHPSNIIKQLPISIEKRIFNLLNQPRSIQRSVTPLPRSLKQMWIHVRNVIPTRQKQPHKRS